jgi:hypothetical protein
MIYNNFKQLDIIIYYGGSLYDSIELADQLFVVDHL